MSHTGVDVIDFLFYTIYPVIGIFVVEAVSRLVKAPKWIKLWTQAVVSTGFGIYYWFILPAPQNFPLTAMLCLHLLLPLFIKEDAQKFLLIKALTNF